MHECSQRLPLRRAIPFSGAVLSVMRPAPAPSWIRAPQTHGDKAASAQRDWSPTRLLWSFMQRGMKEDRRLLSH